MKLLPLPAAAVQGGDKSNEKTRPRLLLRYDALLFSPCSHKAVNIMRGQCKMQSVALSKSCHADVPASP
ncbi:MAG: hypothetical protein JNM75_14790 [Rhodospirillales bacterium]|nr:hypothetical protein [Rhodospirillales bacterium]